MKKNFIGVLGLVIILGLAMGCKKEEKVTLANQTGNQTVIKEVSQVVNQTVNKTVEIANQTIQTVKKTGEQELQKVKEETQKIIGKIQPTETPKPTEISCLKCHKNSEKLANSIKNSKATSGQELVNYLKNLSPHKGLHKNLRDEEIIKAFESFSKPSSPKRKVEGC